MRISDWSSDVCSSDLLWNDGRYEAWPHHHPFAGEWSLHDGYGPYLMAWVEPGRDPDWDIAKSIRHSFRRNMQILSGRSEQRRVGQEVSMTVKLRWAQ